jgi:predicted RNase H-like nuclease (RuvC/YqgF family)
MWAEEICMRHAYKALVLGGLALSLCGFSFGQSLGDVAREQRQKQQSKDNKPAPKVITNEDIPSHDTLADTPRDTADSSSHHSYEGQPSHDGYKKPAEQWRAEIQAQKNAVASTQRHIDELNASVHYVEAARYWNGVQYNQRQLQKQEEVQRMQQQLDQEKKRLEEMQEGARHDGYGNAVYDP